MEDSKDERVNMDRGQRFHCIQGGVLGFAYYCVGELNYNAQLFFLVLWCLHVHFSPVYAGAGA